MLARAEYLPSEKETVSGIAKESLRTRVLRVSEIGPAE
jgi:hypothetical protein